MAKKKENWYSYIAIFNHADDGINISFPDLPGCLSCADTDEEAIRMAKSVLGLYMSQLEDDGDPIPEPTALKDIELDENDMPYLVDVFMPEARAEKVGVNFSKVLREALEDYLGEDEVLKV